MTKTKKKQLNWQQECIIRHNSEKCNGNGEIKKNVTRKTPRRKQIDQIKEIGIDKVQRGRHQPETRKEGTNGSGWERNLIRRLKKLKYIRKKTRTRKKKFRQLPTSIFLDLATLVDQHRDKQLAEMETSSGSSRGLVLGWKFRF